jgi:hypothetical protein
MPKRSDDANYVCYIPNDEKLIEYNNASHYFFTKTPSLSTSILPPE